MAWRKQQRKYEKIQSNRKQQLRVEMLWLKSAAPKMEAKRWKQSRTKCLAWCQQPLNQMCDHYERGIIRDAHPLVRKFIFSVKFMTKRQTRGGRLMVNVQAV